MPVSTIQLKRGSGVPSGLVAGEPAYDLSGKSLYVGNTSGAATRIGESAVSNFAVIGTSGNTCNIDTSGHLTLSGAATVWEDLDFPIGYRTTGVGVPKVETIVGNLKAPQWAINDVEDCQDHELPHSMKLGSSGQFHVHVYTAGVDTDERRVRFQVEYGAVSIDSALTSTTISGADLIIPSGTAAATHLFYHLGWIDFSGLTLGAHLSASLKRIAAISGTAPTADPFATMLQLHYESDSIGSRAADEK